MWRSLFFLAALQATLAAKPQTLADIAFQSPAGWTANQVNDRQIVLSAPGGTPTRYQRLILAVCPDLPGTFAEQFRTAAAQLTQGRTVVNPSAPELSRTRAGLPLITRRASVADSSAPAVSTIFAGVQVDGVLVLAALLAGDASALDPAVLTRFLDNIGPSSAPKTVPRPSAPQPGVVSGNIYDSHGRPLRIPDSRIVVHIWGAGAGGDRVGFDIPVDAGGHYESRVPHGLYGFHARAWLPLNGSTICVDLAPLDGRPTETALDSTPGIVRDFALQLTGPIAGGNSDTIQGYYGGSLTVTDGANWKSPVFGALSRRYPAGTKIAVALQPIGPAVDGSTAAPIGYEYDIQKIATGEHKVDIPLGAYRVSAVLLTPDGTRRPLRVALLPDLTYAATVDLLYKPDPDDHDGHAARPNLFVID